MKTKEKLREAEENTNTSPTEGQKVSGNYKKGKVTIKGLKITVENPAGTIRSGVDKDGNSWECEMPFTYGYFNSTIGKDGDPIDLFIGPEIEGEFDVYIVDQVEEVTRAFDEHKVMFGFESKEVAKEAYLSCYEDDWKGFDKITSISLSKFKKWIKNKDAIKYPASKLNLSARMEVKNSVDDRTKSIRLFGEVIEGKTLASLKEQAGDLDLFDTLVVQIASPGGSVSEGLEIMVWLDQLMQEGKTVITLVVANAYSIASLIMLAANMKLISKHGKVMVHNPMVPEIEYANANDLEKYVKDLRELENVMYNLYQIFTGLEQEQIKVLMDEETYLSPQEAVQYGFAETVVDIKPKSYEMATNIKKEINMSKTLNVLNKVIALVNKEEFVNQLYRVSEGEVDEIEITQADPSTYSEGDRTSVEEGTVKLSDGSKLTIEDYKISEIDKSIEETADEPAKEGEEAFNEGPAPEKAVEEVIEEEAAPAVEAPVVEEEVAEEVAPAVEPVKGKDEMPAKVVETVESTKTTKETVAAQITRVSKWESEVVQDTFELGTKVEYAPTEFEPEPYSVGAGEWMLEDGRQVLTDSDGIIRFIKPAAGDAPAEEAKVEAKVEEAKVEAKETEEEEKVEMVTKEAYDALEAKLVALEKKVDTKAVESKKFEALAAKAIDTIAGETVSGFKPDAKSTAVATAQGSIFAQMKKKAGLK